MKTLIQLADQTLVREFVISRIDAHQGCAFGHKASAVTSFVLLDDLAGDFRDEVVCSSTTQEGGPVLLVFTNTKPIPRREVTRTSSREYRLWMAHNMGGGYASYFEWEPATAGRDASSAPRPPAE